MCLMGVGFESPDDVCQLKWTVFESCHFLPCAEVYPIIETVPLFLSRPRRAKMFLEVSAGPAGDDYDVGAAQPVSTSRHSS